MPKQAKVFEIPEPPQPKKQFFCGFDSPLCNFLLFPTNVSIQFITFSGIVTHEEYTKFIKKHAKWDYDSSTVYTWSTYPSPTFCHGLSRLRTYKNLTSTHAWAKNHLIIKEFELIKKKTVNVYFNFIYLSKITFRILIHSFILNSR